MEYLVMARKLKHSKIKNTSILFELLTRQITADVLAGKSTKSVKMVKKYFNENTELGKELQLYRILSEKQYQSEARANDILEMVLSSREKINKCLKLVFVFFAEDENTNCAEGAGKGFLLLMS